MIISVTNYVINYLLPNMEPHSGIVHDDIEENNVTNDAGCECDDDGIYDTTPLSLRLIQGADSLPAKTHDECTGEHEETEESECPLVFSVERISECRGDRHAPEPKENDDDWRETAQGCKYDRDTADFENFACIHMESIYH